MLLRTLASGSGGNCTLVQHDDTAILIDAGISCKKIAARLREAGVAPESLSAILLTHAHFDHIAGLGVFLKRFPVPVFATPGAGADTVRKFPLAAGFLHTFPAGTRLDIGSLSVQSFPTPHDAAESVCYRCTAGAHSLAVVTDLGWAPESLRAAVAGVELALVEANHDEDWLRDGPYPPALQARILGRFGHLCNEAGGELGAFLSQNGAKTLILAHLSRENNSPEHAYQVVSGVLESFGVHPELEVAPWDALSRPFSL